EVRRRVAEALGRVGLGGLEGRVPFHPSGGEKRRAALAGVAGKRPGALPRGAACIFLRPPGPRRPVERLGRPPVPPAGGGRAPRGWERMRFWKSVSSTPKLPS